MKSFFSNFRIMLAGGFLTSQWEDIDNANVIIVRHDANCGYYHSGKVYSPIIDTIVEYCIKEGLTVCSLVAPFSRMVGERAYNSPIVLNRHFLWIALISRILAKLIGSERSEKWKAKKRTALWCRVLDNVKPELVIAIQPDVYLCRACRVRNVSVYDFQHGVIAPDHWWYGKKLKDEVSSDKLPTGFLCWDKPSAAALEKWAPERGSSVDIVGNPWFDRFLCPDEKDRLVQDAVAQGRLYTNDRPTILVSLQWGLHIEYYQNSDFNKVMCNPLEEVIKRTHDKYNWLLRLHPVQLRGLEGEICETYLSCTFGHLDTVEWHEATRLPLPVLLDQSDLHITDMSTVVIEAAWMGVPSALLNPHLNEGGKLESLYLHERQLGIATLLPQDVDSIESWIEEKYLTKADSTIAELTGGKFGLWLKKVIIA